jgi:hypothetical protein
MKSMVDRPQDRFPHRQVLAHIRPEVGGDLTAARCHDVVTSRGKHCDNTGRYPRTRTDVFSLARPNFRRCGEYPRIPANICSATL